MNAKLHNPSSSNPSSSNPSAQNTSANNPSSSNGQSFNTNQILDSIKNKLFNSGSQPSAQNPSASNPSAQSTSAQPASQPSAQAPKSSSTAFQNNRNNAAAPSNSFSYDDFEDFKMSDDFGQPASTSFSSSANDTQEINAAYRAYQGNKYTNAISAKPKAQSPSFDAFEDFEHYSEPTFNSSNFENEEFEEESSYEERNNLHAFPARPQQRSVTNNEQPYAPVQQNAYTPKGSESINSIMARMLQQEIATYISSWAGQNNQVFTRYLQEACDQIAQQWCTQNMSSLMNNAVDAWCENNLEQLCANVIREELHKEHKVA